MNTRVALSMAIIAIALSSIIAMKVRIAVYISVQVVEEYMKHRDIADLVMGC